MLGVNQSLESTIYSGSMGKRKRISNSPHHMTAPAAKKVFMSESVYNHSGVTEASGLHCNVHALLSMSENSPPPSSPGTTTECMNCIGLNGGSCMSDWLSDDSDDSTCTVDSGVETDVVKTSRRPAKLMKPTIPAVFNFIEGSNSTKKHEILHAKDGFVRRMANLNARARVAVLFQVGKYKKNRQPSSTEANVETATNEDEHNAITKNSVKVSSAHLDVQTPAIPFSYETANSTLEVEALEVCYSTTETMHNEDFKSEPFSCNSLGLLYDGRTIHPHLRILLQDGKVPSQIIPLIVPAAMSFVYERARHIIDQEIVKRSHSVHKTRRGDNGWACFGEPIKTVQYRDENNKLRIRKYYIGVKRKEEIIFVRNCICAKSGTRKPYVAKVASIWQENGGVMMTLFWYYRWEEVQDQQASNFVECELLASQHHDQNTVACIEDKCFVLGLSEYSRYKAAQKRHEDSLHLPTTLLVPNCHAEREASVHQHWLPTTDTDPALIFLCYQGYNHITGKVLRPS